MKSEKFCSYLLHFKVILVLLVDVDALWDIEKSRNLRWSPFENMTYYLRLVRLWVYVADLKGNILGRTICPQKFVVINFFSLEVKNPTPKSQKIMKSPV